MIPYTQSTPFTTAAASLLTILHNKKQIPLTKENEFKIWHSSVNLPTRGSSIYGLALVAKRHGLNPKVVVEKKEYEFPDYRFYRYTKEDVEHAAFSELTHLTKAEEQSIPIQEKSFTLKHDSVFVFLLMIVLIQKNMCCISFNDKWTKKEFSYYKFRF